MFKKILYILGGVIILVGVFAFGWMLALNLGARAGLAATYGPGMMGGYGMRMHGGLPFMRGGFGWGGPLFMGGLAVLGWLLQIGLIVAIVTWLIKPRGTQTPTQSPSQAPAPTATPMPTEPPVQSQ
jgi:hypothetical protein